MCTYWLWVCENYPKVKRSQDRVSLTRITRAWIVHESTKIDEITSSNLDNCLYRMLNQFISISVWSREKKMTFIASSLASHFVFFPFTHFLTDTLFSNKLLHSMFDLKKAICLCLIQCNATQLNVHYLALARVINQEQKIKKNDIRKWWNRKTSKDSKWIKNE